MFNFALVQLVSIILYLQNYFPLQINTLENLNVTTATNEVHLPQKIDKLVLIIIDSMRYDYVTGELMQKSVKLAETNGCLVKLRAETPTVTLPRIKAITTGNIPQFIDIIRNLADPDQLDDSLLHRMQAKNKSVVFYGDETWLKIFPKKLFKRSEETVQFFITDFYEVDTNVTRNARKEMRENDWDLMILHYLGLDHIGHVIGSKNQLINSKLTEMDSIIAEISSSINNSVVLVTSDHGMRDGGGHGGPTAPEIFLPLLILGMPCENSEFSQIDLAANLAILLGVDIPQTNIGQLQSAILRSKLTKFEYLDVLKLNTLQLNSKLQLCNDILENATLFHRLYQLDPLINEIYGDQAETIYKNCSRIISERLQISPTDHHNTIKLLIAVCAIFFVFRKIYDRCFDKFEKFMFLKNTLLLLMVALSFFDIANIVEIILLAMIGIFTVKTTIVSLDLRELFRTRHFVLILLLIQPLTFFTTSFLVEEHKVWYFLSTTLIVLQIRKSNKVKNFLLLFSVRLISTLNETSQFFNEHFDYFKIYFGIVLSLILLCNFSQTKFKFTVVLDLFILLQIYSFRLNENVLAARIVWFFILIHFLISFLTKNHLITTLILIAAFLLKPISTVLIPICVGTSWHLKRTISAVENRILTHYILGTVLFFAQGHDNTFGSVDVSSGYIGLETYQPVLVGAQMFLNRYALTALSHWLLLRNEKIEDVDKSLWFILLLKTNTILIVCIVLLVFKNHPFVWSIFASKIFIEGANYAWLFIEICVYKLYKGFNKKSNNAL